MRGTTLAPIHAFVQFNSPSGFKNAFFANMTCSESQVYDPFYKITWKKTTWSFDDSMEKMVANLMVNGTKAVTGGRDGNDSNCWFYKVWFHDAYGPISNDKFQIEIILRKNMHKLAENAVVPVPYFKGDTEIEKVQLNNEFAASLITGEGDQLFSSSKGFQTYE